VQITYPYLGENYKQIFKNSANYTCKYFGSILGQIDYSRLNSTYTINSW